MFFLMRSVLWLGIVFWAMPWNGEGSPGRSALDAARGLAQSTAQAASEACVATPAECLAAARKLHALFEKIAAEPLEASSATGPAQTGGALSALDRLPQWRNGRP